MGLRRVDIQDFPVRQHTVIWCWGLRLSPVRSVLEAIYASLRLSPVTTVGLLARLRPLPGSQLSLG